LFKFTDILFSFNIHFLFDCKGRGIGMFVQEEDKDWNILLKHITYGEKFIEIWDDWVKIWKNVGRINNFVFRKIIIIFALETF